MTDSEICFALTQQIDELKKEKARYKLFDNPSLYRYDCICERIRTLQDVINFINYHTWQK